MIYGMKVSKEQLKKLDDEMVLYSPIDWYAFAKGKISYPVEIFFDEQDELEKAKKVIL